MSLAEVMTVVAALPKGEKQQLFSYLENELKSHTVGKSGLKPITRPEDNCPLSDEEIRAGAGDKSGRTLAEILRSRGLR